MSDLKHETKIADMMGFYQKAFPVQTRLDGDGLVLYAKMLSRYTIPQLRAAMDKIILTCKYFPSIAEICEAVESLTEHVSTGGKGIPTADEAWNEMIRQANWRNDTQKWEFSTPEIAQAVTMFGRQKVFEMLDADIAIHKAQFRKSYEAVLSRAKERKVNNAALENSKMVNIVDKLAARSTLTLEGGAN